MNIPAANLSSIMEENEFEFINSAIKERLNKDAKELKKLYQATVDGFKPETFHSKCDGIPNTLVLFKSEGNRRFADLHQVNGPHHYMVNLFMTKIHFYFLWIKNVFILLMIMEELFFVKVNVDQLLAVHVIYMLKVKHFIQMNKKEL